MIVTNDERREVAARLRDFESLRPVFKESNICGFLEALNVGYLDWEGVCNRLADLIELEPERSCLVKYDEYGTPRCGECECVVYDEYIDALVNYCPNCGSKVLDD